MKPSIPISTVIITLNAERYLEQVLRSVEWCDEVVILDSGSTDRTLDIARSHGATIAHRDFDGYGPQKRAAIAMARHDWILSIDADEVVDPSLAEAVRSIDLTAVGTAYRLHRRTFIGPTEIRHGIFGNEWVVRCFHRSTASMSDDRIHESVHSRASIRPLTGSLLHYSFEDAAELFVRMANYSRRKAATYRAQRRSAASPLLLGRAAWAFMRCYVLKGGFRDGRYGVLIALSAACDAALGLAMASGSGQ